MDSSLAAQQHHAFAARVKQEHQQHRVHALPRCETESDSMASASPVSDSDTLSFPAAAAMLFAPPALLDDEQEMFFGLAMDDDASSDSHDSIKTESDGTGASSSSYSHSTPATVGGSRRAMTPEERRKRRNMKERERVQGVKDRIEALRHDLAQLQEKHHAFKKELEQRVIVRASSDDDIQALVAAYLSQPGATLDARDAELLRQYLVLKKETEQLQFLKRSLEDQLKPKASEMTMMKAILDASTPLALEEIEHSEAIRAPNSTGKRSASTSSTTTGTAVVPLETVDPLEVVPPIRMDAVSLFEAMLAEDPLTPDEARAFVEDTCREMMEGLTRSDWVEGFEGFGWRGSRRLDDDGSALQFRLSQRFPSVSATQLVQKTWTMLTNLDDYRRIQPQTQQLRVIQRVNDECWVIAVAVGKERPRLAHLLVARAIIHGGYLITFRTIPLLRKGRGGSELARQKFVETETGGMHVNVHSWYNFQERPNASGGVDCEVIFGGCSRNGDRHYLKQLQMEVVAGITRWQSAVGFSNFMFSSTLPRDDTGHEGGDTSLAPPSTG